MKIVIATNNQHKLEEFESLFSSLNIEVLSLKDIDFNDEIDETGKTFHENSLIKAQCVANKTSYSVIADDSGLCVDALNGFPGIYSARFATEQGGNDIANLRIIELLKNHSNKKASFHCVITLCNYKNNSPLQFEGVCPGLIESTPKGEGGFGYDPIFYSTEAKICFGEASKDIKNKYSHRAKALAKLLEYLKNS